MSNTTDTQQITIPRVGMIFTSPRVAESHNMPADTAWEVIGVNVAVSPNPLGVGELSITALCTLLPLDDDTNDISDQLPGELPLVNLDTVDYKLV